MFLLLQYYPTALPSSKRYDKRYEQEVPERTVREETQREVLIESLKADCEVRAGRLPGFENTPLGEWAIGEAVTFTG